MLSKHILARLAADGFRPQLPGSMGAETEEAYTGLHLRVMRAKAAARYTPMLGGSRHLYPRSDGARGRAVAALC
jgi:hypothetical protein